MDTKSVYYVATSNNEPNVFGGRFACRGLRLLWFDIAAVSLPTVINIVIQINYRRVTTQMQCVSSYAGDFALLCKPLEYIRDPPLLVKLNSLENVECLQVEVRDSTGTPLTLTKNNFMFEIVQ